MFSAARASQVAPTTPCCRCDVSISIYSPPGLLFGRAVLRTTQSRWARSTAAAASQGRLGTASSPGPEPRAVPSPLRSEPHATCDATNRHVPCRLNGALPQPPAHPWHVSRVEMPVAARATLPTARPSRLVKFGIHRPTRAYRPLAGVGVVSFDDSDRVCELPFGDGHCQSTRGLASNSDPT
jgi:hypothetical protein